MRIGDWPLLLARVSPEGTLCWVDLFDHPLGRGKFDRPMLASVCSFAGGFWIGPCPKARFVVLDCLITR
jgi:hypothetical protein